MISVTANLNPTQRYFDTELQPKYVALNSFQGRKIERPCDAEINSARRSSNTLIATRYKDRAKVSYLQCDSFQGQNKTNPSFGSIPRKAIFESLNEMTKQSKKIMNSSELSEVVKDFFSNKLSNLLIADSNMSKIEMDNFLAFRHELVNKFSSKQELITNPSLREFVSKLHPEVVSDEQYLKFQKSELDNVASEIKNSTNKWARTDNWTKTPDKEFSTDTVFRAFSKTLNKTSQGEIKIEGQELLKSRKIQNPERLCTLMSQALLAATKHAEGKPVEIKIEKLQRKFKPSYYASFIIPEAKPIPDYKIEEIINYKPSKVPYRQISTTIEDNEGEFLDVIKTVKENWRAFDLPYLIEKGRKKGVCVQIPLVGVN